MIAGNVDAEGRITIRIQISDGSPPYREIDAVIATELNADLVLPPQLASVLGLRLIGDNSLEAEGDVQDAPYYVAYIQWHHGMTPAVAIEAPEELPLIGRGLLLGSFLRADFMAGGEVALYSIR